VAIATAAAPVANTSMRSFNLNCILNTFSMSPYLDSFQNCSLAGSGTIGGRSCANRALPHSRVRAFLRTLWARSMSTAAGVTPPAGTPAGTEELDKACGSWLVATNCVFVTNSGPTCLGSSSHWNSIGAQDFSGARVFGRLYDGTIREPQLFRTPNPCHHRYHPSIRPLA
jgi:hypothetical protein